MIQIGNQTSCWAATASEPFDYALANGFDAFEWFPDKKPSAGWDEQDLAPAQRRSIYETGRARGLRFSVHARLEASVLQPASMEWWRKDLDLAVDLGAALLNIHFEQQAGFPAFVQGLQPLLEMTAAAGLQLAIENTPYHAPEDFNRLFAGIYALRSTPTEHAGMCLDLGHANLCSATRNDYLGFLARLDPDLPIIHLHLHENWGDADTHLPLFTGPAGHDDSGIRRLLSELQRRQYSGSIILEQWPHPPLLLNNARDHLLKLWRALGNGAPSSSGTAAFAGQHAPAAPGPALESIAANSSAMPVAGSNQPKSVHGAGLVEAIATADRQSRSWREKLDAVQRLLTEGPAPLAKEQLVDIAIYLRFLGTGEIACAEDGRHFRPAHHARIALGIEQRLAGLSEAEEVWLARRIYPWLPSSEQQFQRAEPLTRIRDIAHRNDIPPELKREIKERLQNKLHRCAGPEDLVTATNLLERITAPNAHYAGDFVEQFKIFHAELREFFNAQSLDERLEGLWRSAAPEPAGLIRRFLDQKKKPTDNLETGVAALQALTQLRTNVLDRTEQKRDPESQGLLLADIGLEDYAFVVLSQIRNRLVPETDLGAWRPLLKVMVLTVTNLQLSGIRREECAAIKAELEAWQENLLPTDREQMLRLKASAERCRRLGEDFGQWMVDLFFGRAEALGKALGVAETARRVLAEAEVRRHLVFQLSNLGDDFLWRLRRQLGLPGWDVIVAGNAAGKALAMARLDDLPGDRSGPTLALLERAEGDEEIPQDISGIVLGHTLPHLSHLAVRARQARIVFVACEEKAEFENARRFEGQMIRVEAGPDRFTFQTGEGVTAVSDVGRAEAGWIPQVELVSVPVCLAVAEVTQKTGGGKAFATKRLAELAANSEAGFSVPKSLVLPFGVMEIELERDAELKSKYQRCLERCDGAPAPAIAAEAAKIRDLLQRIPVPTEITAAIGRTFGPGSRLMVRSSATGEDLAALAGAGLYETVANVLTPDLSAAVRTVWASLWTERAALSRAQSGLRQSQAHMAVLVQEMIVPEYAFVLHTTNPLTGDAAEVYAELVVGLGETLVSARQRGTPFRVICHKESGAVSTVGFANFSSALWPTPESGVREEIVDYSRVGLSRDGNLRQALGRRLGQVGSRIEEAFGGAQDIEGVVVGEKIFIVQSRPQQGLRPR